MKSIYHKPQELAKYLLLLLLGLILCGAVSCTSHHERETIAIDTTTLQAGSLIPVSYTHLDVYKRQVVLQQMKRAGYISDETYTTSAAEPIRVNFTSNAHSDGLAPYYREFVRLLLTAKKPKRSDYSQWNQEQYAIDSLLWETQPIYGWCQKNKKSDGSHYDLYADGCLLYTSRCV